MDLDYVNYDDYISTDETENTTSDDGQFLFNDTQTPLAPILVTINVIICVFGLGGNSLVIWICGWKMKKTVITTFYISLAISNLLFCVFLPLEVFYMMTLHWPFGLLMCKLTSSVLFLNMYSSVFLLVLISIDRCVMVSFPVWSQNHRCPWKALVIVAIVWVLSALLTLPSMIYRHITAHGTVTQCYSNYKVKSQHKAVAQTRFICGFVIPFLIIVVCGVVLAVQLKNVTLKSARPYKILSALICSFFFCWVPYHTFIFLELDFNYSPDVLRTGLRIGATLAAANTFMSPVLYVFIGNDFKTTLKRSLTSRIEAALADDLRSRSKSVDIVQL
ncbi:chemerin-like receptor 1 [Boleophthalmus pectinirostris]|uniref:chemerin-like receptor 1 n=1 Tax=Boleophthalmus pectinirostris TaxID=150288 RepID=UPI000A1C4DC2|nr:chemerin-like receptor 1 [Boleophthalmus pectinirostris]